MQPIYSQLTGEIFTGQRAEVVAFLKEWNTSEKKGWMASIDAPIQTLAEAYITELERLLSGSSASQEWVDVLQCAKILRAAAAELLPRTALTSLPLSEPKTLADRTFGFLVDAMYQFDSSLGGLRAI